MPYLINGDMSVIASFDGDMGIVNHLNGELGTVTPYSTLPTYRGQTDIFPTSEAQVLNTDGFVLGTNIIIEPIPQNYGLITWNGSTLTVS